MDRIVLFVIGIIVAAVLGYLVGKNQKKPQGEIQFVVEPDGEGNDRVNCVFKVSRDWDVLMKEDYILFRVWRDPRIIELEKKELH